MIPCQSETLEALSVCGHCHLLIPSYSSENNIVHNFFRHRENQIWAHSRLRPWKYEVYLSSLLDFCYDGQSIATRLNARALGLEPFGGFW